MSAPNNITESLTKFYRFTHEQFIAATIYNYNKFEKNVFVRQACYRDITEQKKYFPTMRIRI